MVLLWILSSQKLRKVEIEQGCPRVGRLKSLILTYVCTFIYMPTLRGYIQPNARQLRGLKGSCF